MSKSKEWYKEQINNLQDWLLLEKISKSTNDTEKKAYNVVLHKIIDMFEYEDDDMDFDYLLEIMREL